ncbi:hypothetical protein [Desulfovibrio intestinalis]|uniref:Uncharacterized protein n=1 Tax=Desulfovibrio intestinalis TaxID=58621 RepID=A0A7W8C1C2_9BACT|nr:hypothetical protein [Desulfovibrio intestinalis]MBB5143023.1 hypothetical protein [Desulfovibrio intestinalis]
MSSSTKLETVATPYGCMHNVHVLSRWDNGAPRACHCLAPDIAPTPHGWLMPLHDITDVRRSCENSFTLYPNGMWRSLELQHQTSVPTPLGLLPAEWLSWHPGGALKRILTRKGRLSGYWTEKDEEALAPCLDLTLPAGRFTGKVQGLRFHPGGQCASITLWPGQIWTISTPVGPLPIRYGCAFYEDGSVRSCEPARPVSVPTPLGNIRAFDPAAQAVCGDTNSLEFASPETSESQPGALRFAGATKTYASLHSGPETDEPRSEASEGNAVLSLSTISTALHWKSGTNAGTIAPRMETDQLTGMSTVVVPLHLSFGPRGQLAVDDGLEKYTLQMTAVQIQPHINLPDMRSTLAGSLAKMPL